MLTCGFNNEKERTMTRSPGKIGRLAGVLAVVVAAMFCGSAFADEREGPNLIRKVMFVR